MGQSVDMAALLAKNKHVRAVGNMNVDAAGNTLDSENRVVQDSTRRVNEAYGRTTVNPGAVSRPNRGAPTIQPDVSNSELEALSEFDSEEPVGKK
jgi:hypothetical protein